MPIVGQFGSLAGFGVFPGGSFESIATVTVGSGGASSIEFTSIPSGFQHLQIRYLCRGVRSNVREDLTLQLNSDTASNYAYHRLLGLGSSAAADASTSVGYGYTSMIAGANLTASIFGAGVVDILDYASTSKTKTVRTFGGVDGNGDTNVGVFVTSSLWNSTSAVTSVKLYGFNANLAQHSTAALYGVKAP